MVISADFEKQTQYFDKKILLYYNIALSQYFFIVILLVKIAHLMRALDKYLLTSLHISYFINHYTKSTSWEDPRVRYQQIGKPTSSVAKENKFSSSSTAAATTTTTTSAATSASNVAGSSSGGTTTTTTSEVHLPPSSSHEHVPLQVRARP